MLSRWSLMEVSDASFRLAIALEMLSNVNKMFLVSFYCPASAPTSLHPTSLPLSAGVGVCSGCPACFGMHSLSTGI